MLFPSLQSDSMPHPTLQHRLLKHIPKAASHGLCGLLVTVINRILSDPLSAEPWRLLLSFGAFTLTQTVRGGKRHNLTSKIKARVENFFSTAPSGHTNLFASQYSKESGAAGRSAWGWGEGSGSSCCRKAGGWQHKSGRENPMLRRQTGPYKRGNAGRTPF